MLVSQEPIPDSLREKADALIKKLLEREEILGETDPLEHPTSFSNSLEWAGDTFYPNVAALTEQIVVSRSPFGPKLRGWKLVKDRVLLVGCALLVILAMMLGSALFFGK